MVQTNAQIGSSLRDRCETNRVINDARSAASELAPTEDYARGEDCIDWRNANLKFDIVFMASLKKKRCATPRNDSTKT